MPASDHPPPLKALRPGEPFPPIEQAWGPDDPAPGLLAVGGALDVPTLRAAYAATIFPWFSEGEPLLWWSPDPRMVLRTECFRLHRSLRKVIARFRATPGCTVRVNTAFDAVMLACAHTPRAGGAGTWISEDMRAAYGQLHRAGQAHSVEVWLGQRLAAGLYCVALGQAVFGESMFTHVTDGSKIALAALVALCRAHGMPLIDCQQNTQHLAFMGAAEMPRADFARQVATLAARPGPRWQFDPIYWNALFPPSA